MGGEPDNLVLACLRRIDARLEKLADDLREVKQRLGRLEELGAPLSRRIDGLDLRLDLVPG